VIDNIFKPSKIAATFECRRLTCKEMERSYAFLITKVCKVFMQVKYY